MNILGSILQEENVQALDTNKFTVLVAEDDEALQKLTRIVLQRQGFNVLMAGNAEEALHLARTYGRGVDLLLTDMCMPGMPGSALGSEFKKAHPEAKVVYMTAYAANEVARTLPGETVIFKPFCLNHFSAVVRDSLLA